MVSVELESKVLLNLITVIHVENSVSIFSDQSFQHQFVVLKIFASFDHQAIAKIQFQTESQFIACQKLY